MSPTLTLNLHKGSTDINSVQAPTLASGQTVSELACNMTNGIMLYVNSKWIDLTNKMQSDYAIATEFVSMIDDLIALFPVVGQDVKNVIDFGAAVYGANILSTKAGYDTTAQGLVECYLYCILLAMSNPDFTGVQLTQWVSDILGNSTIANNVKIAIAPMINGIGLPELRKRALVYAHQSAVCDCAGCNTRTVQVIANGWNGANGTDTGIDLIDGQTVTITTTGSIVYTPGGSSGPDGIPNGGGFSSGYCTTADPVALIYKIGPSGAWTKAGSSITVTPAAAGRLYLMPNEQLGSPDTGQFFVDNSGYWASVITY